MNKKLSWLLAASLIIIVIGAFYFLGTSLKGGVSEKGTTTTSSSPAVSATITGSTIRVPFTLYDDFHKSEKNLAEVSLYVDQANGNTISFQATPTNESQNPNYNVLFNGNKIGGVAGVGIAMTSFSPDKNYFAFRTRMVCGATCTSITMNVLDLENHKLINVFPPVRQNEKDSSTAQYQDGIGVPVIDSYSWEPSGNLHITFFYIGTDPKTGVPYRISSVETWNYNLGTGKYTNLGT